MNANEPAFDRILVIDDNPAIHADFRKILCCAKLGDNELDEMAGALFDEETTEESGESYEVESASQGIEAFEKLSAAMAEGRPFSLAFVDVRMPPGWDGIETTRKLWDVDPNLQVVICTAYSDYNWLEMKSQLGRTDRLLLLKKPFDQIEVLQLASALTQKRRLLHLSQIHGDRLQALVADRTEALRILAETDPLTHLPNRKRFLQRLEQRVHDRRLDPNASLTSTEAVLFLDLDNFKLVNDSLGHGAGDALLVQVAQRLLDTPTLMAINGRSADLPPTNDAFKNGSRGVRIEAARLGGDEFAMVVAGLHDTEAVLELARGLIEQVKRPIEVYGRSLTPSVSVGIALIEDQVSAEELLRQADTAMYDAKTRGRNGVSLFDQTMYRRATERLTIQSGIQTALDESQFELHLQPLIELHSGQVVGHEALIRWSDPDGTVYSPANFIPIAEQTGQIIAIGQWVLDRALELIIENQAQISLMNQLTPTAYRMSVNVSRNQLIQPGFVNYVSERLACHGVSGSMLAIEVTETTFIDNQQIVADVLRQLRRLGIEIYLDDFGTGYSSLSFLNRFPIDVLKIDRSFVSGESIQEDKVNSAAILEAIVVMASALGVKVIAEGVETAEQLGKLKSLGCTMAQGYFLGRPASPEHWFKPTEASPAIGGRARSFQTNVQVV